MRIEQIDREAAASVAVLPEMRDLILSGRADHHAEPFAVHRQRGHDEAVKAVVEWMRRGAMFAATDQEVADAIERGEHFKART